MKLLKKDVLLLKEYDEKIYIPLVCANGENVLSLVRKDDYIFKGSVVGKIKGNGFPIFSSVSGKIIGIEQKMILNSTKVECIVIENDYKQKRESGVGNLGQINKNDFLEILNNFGVFEFDNDYLPVSLKYNSRKINYLIIDSTSNNIIIEQYCEEILEILDMITEINDIYETIIMIDKRDKYLLRLINNYIGTYLKIKVKVVSKKIDYNIKYDTIVHNISTVYAIYEALKLNKPVIEKYIAISYNNITNNILVKFGMPLKDIFDKLDINYNYVIINNEFILNDIEDLIITPEINNIKISGQNK